MRSAHVAFPVAKDLNRFCRRPTTRWFQQASGYFSPYKEQIVEHLTRAVYRHSVQARFKVLLRKKARVTDANHPFGAGTSPPATYRPVQGPTSSRLVDSQGRNPSVVI